jgi:hypothetical protein
MFANTKDYRLIMVSTINKTLFLTKANLDAKYYELSKIKKSLAMIKCSKDLSFVTSMGNSNKLQKGKLQSHSIAIYINFAWGTLITQM